MNLTGIREIIPDMLQAAQRVLDEWVQDEDGYDEELGQGGACQDVASAMAGVIAEAGGETAQIYTEFDGGHVFLMAHLEEGAFSVDIPPSVYEYGAGYVWTKRPGVVLSIMDLAVSRVEGPMKAAEFRHRYLDEPLVDEGELLQF